MIERKMGSPNFPPFAAFCCKIYAPVLLLLDDSLTLKCA